MSFLGEMVIPVAARESKLSLAQVEEVRQEIQSFHPCVVFVSTYLQTQGDKDLSTSLRYKEKTDFFTKEIDQLLLHNQCRIAIHSAKDLPEPLHPDLEVIALTRGVDPSDVLVLRQEETVHSLPRGARIGTSSLRREQIIKALRQDLQPVDIRGTVEKRLELLDQKHIEGLVMAEAALLRLKLTNRSRIFLQGAVAKGQGQLAVVARKEDKQMKELFSCIDVRQS